MLGIKSGTGHRRLGLKTNRGGVRAGVKGLYEHSEDVESTASQVGGIAGEVAKYAGMGATGMAMIGAEPVAGALLGVAGLAKGVEAGAEMVGKGAGAVSKVKGAFSRIDRLL